MRRVLHSILENSGEMRKLSKARRKRLRLNGALLRSMRCQFFWQDQDDNKPRDVEESKAYDRYISWLVARYDLTKIPYRLLAKKLQNLANCLANESLPNLKCFPYKRWERSQYQIRGFYKDYRPVELKKRWLRTVPRKRFTHVHELSDPQYDFFKTSLKFSQKGQKFMK